MTDVRVKIGCPRCKHEGAFEYTPAEHGSESSGIRDLIEKWPWQTRARDLYDETSAAYLQRVRTSAQTLEPSTGRAPESVNVCWSCLDGHDLEDAINGITFQDFFQGEVVDEVIAKLKNAAGEEVDDVSEREFQSMEVALKREMQLAEMLESEYQDVERQLKAAVEIHAGFLKTSAAAKCSAQMAQNSLLAVEAKLEELERQIAMVPNSDHEVWTRFFDIEDHLTHASVGGVPMAYNEKPEVPWNVANASAQNITGSILVAACLLGRLMNSLPTERPEWFHNRPHRVTITPVAVESRSPGPDGKRAVYHLSPFVHDSINPNWHIGLLIFSGQIALMYRYWKLTKPNDPPPYVLPQPSDSDFYKLDLTEPHRWNEKMRQLLLCLKHLIALRFPPTSTSSSIVPKSPSL